MGWKWRVVLKRFSETNLYMSNYLVSVSIAFDIDAALAKGSAEGEEED